MERQNLLGGPPATYLLPHEEADAALRAGEAPEKVAARFPAYSAAWAALAEPTIGRWFPPDFVAAKPSDRKSVV